MGFHRRTPRSYRPAKQQIALPLDADAVPWFKRQNPVGGAISSMDAVFKSGFSEYLGLLSIGTKFA